MGHLGEESLPSRVHYTNPQGGNGCLIIGTTRVICWVVKKLRKKGQGQN